jgi:hypothetical protein
LPEVSIESAGLRPGLTAETAVSAQFVEH